MTSLQHPVVIGRVGAAWGVQGWCRVHSFTEPMDNLLDYRQCWLSREGRWQAVEIDAGRRHGKGLVLHIRGVDTPEAVRPLVGCELAVEAGAMPPLEPGEYYWHQLEGLRVETLDGQLLGEVDHLLATGANDVLVVRPCADSIDQRERLLPWLPGQVVLAVELKRGRVRVDWDVTF